MFTKTKNKDYNKTTCKLDYLCKVEYKYIVTKKGIAGVVGRGCVSFGGRWGCENSGGAGIRLEHVYASSLAWCGGGSLCCRGSGVGGCCSGVENVFLVWRHRCVVVLAGLLDYCRSVSDRVVVYLV